MSSLRRSAKQKKRFPQELRVYHLHELLTSGPTALSFRASPFASATRQNVLTPHTPWILLQTCSRITCSKAIRPISQKDNDADFHPEPLKTSYKKRKRKGQGDATGSRAEEDQKVQHLQQKRTKNRKPFRL